MIFLSAFITVGAIRVGAQDAPPGKYTTTWVGNSLVRGDEHVPIAIDSLFVTPDGTVLTSASWDEGGGELTEFDSAGAWKRMAGHTHGWGYGGGGCATATDQYIFITQKVDSEGGGLVGSSWPIKGQNWWGISRRKRDDPQKGVPFDDGRGQEGDVLPHAFLIVEETPIPTPGNLTSGSQPPIPGITGIAADSRRLFVANPTHDRVRVYDAESMALLTDWEHIPRLGTIALDSKGRLWIAQGADGDHVATVTAYDTDGHALQNVISLGKAVEPVGIAFDPKGHVAVADGGADADILTFDPDHLSGVPTRPLKTVGSSLFAGDGPAVGRITPGKFSDLTGVGIDRDGNLYISSSRNGATLEKFDSSGQQQWARYGLTFVDNSSIDPQSGDVYSSEEHYHFDWAKTDPGSEWSYAGKTWDHIRFPNDPRLAHENPPLMRRLNGGQLYAFASDQMADGIFVYRFDPSHLGEVAIPCAAITKGALKVPNAPHGGQLLWTDLNGDGQTDAGEFQQLPPENSAKETPGLGDATWGWYVDEAGDVWQTVNGDGPTRGLRHFPLASFDQHGTPLYRVADMTVTPAPAPFLHNVNDGLERCVYVKASDTMYLGGYTADAQNEKYWGAFRVISRYDHWSKGNRTAAWTLHLPWKVVPGAAGETPIGFAIAGDYIFEVGCTTKSQVLIYRTSDASLVGTLTPNNGLFNVDQTGWVDMRPFGVQAIRRPNGEYAICVEEDWHAKTVIYRWNPAAK